MNRFEKIKSIRLGATNMKQLTRQTRHNECCKNKLNCEHEHIKDEVSVKRISGKYAADDK